MKRWCVCVCVLLRARNSLICSFRLIKWATVSDSLRSLKTNERLWANRSGHSYQKSDHEQIAQVTHDKWATVSDSLRSLMKNERLSDSLKIFLLKSYFLVCFIPVYIFWFKKITDLFIPSFLMSDVSKSLRLLTINKRCERTAQVAHQQWGMWANHSGRSPKMSKWANRLFFWANGSFTNFFAKNERLAQKTDEQIPSPV